MSMNSQRVTISLPNYLYQKLIARTASGKISSFVAHVLEKDLFGTEMKKDPIEEFFALRKTLPKISRKQILNAIHKGRT